MIRACGLELPLGKENPQEKAESERQAHSARYCRKTFSPSISLCISGKSRAVSLIAVQSMKFQSF
jgi:hypothetical protein